MMETVEWGNGKYGSGRHRTFIGGDGTHPVSTVFYVSKQLFGIKLPGNRQKGQKVETPLDKCRNAFLPQKQHIRPNFM